MGKAAPKVSDPEYEPGAVRVMVRVMYQMGVVRELWRRAGWSWPAP